MSGTERREKTTTYPFKRVSKEQLELIVSLCYAAEAPLRFRHNHNKVKNGLLGFGEQYVEMLQIDVTDSHCEELLLYLEEPLDRSSAEVAPQIEYILKDYYKRLYYPKHAKMVEELRKKITARSKAYANLQAMEDAVYERWQAARQQALKQGTQIKCSKEGEHAILNYNPFAHLDPNRTPTPASIEKAWRKYQQARLVFKRDLRNLYGYSKQASHEMVNRIGFKHFPNQMIGGEFFLLGQADNVVKIAPRPAKNIKAILYKHQAGYCNGCVQRFESRHLEIDHIVPKAKGGQHTNSNLQLLCGNCNRIKGDDAMDIFLTRLKGVGVKKPRKPKKDSQKRKEEESKEIKKDSPTEWKPVS